MICFQLQTSPKVDEVIHLKSGRSAKSKQINCNYKSARLVITKVRHTTLLAGANVHNEVS